MSRRTSSVELRELRRAMKAATGAKGPLDVPGAPRGRQGAAWISADFHGFRHAAGWEAIHDGDTAEEVSWQLGLKSSVVTREIQSAEPQAKRRARMEPAMEAFWKRQGEATAADGTSEGAEVVELRRAGDGRQ